jgi:exopolysaccharide production protein ExoZ
MRYPNVQLLRVAAAIGVVIHHTGAHGVAVLGVPKDELSLLLARVIVGFPVPLFFAVSGFVLTLAVRGTPGGHSARQFLLARFLRLFPGYWLAVALALTLSAAGLLSATHRELVPFVNLGTITLWPNGGRSPLFLGVEWSLVYEVFLSVALCGLALFGRWLAVAVVCWLAVLGVKTILAPGYGTDVLPHWTTIGLSGFVVPFLLGVLTAHLKDRGSRVAAVAVVALVGWCLTAGASRAETADAVWWNWGVAAAGTVWLAVRLPQVSPEHRLARLGDATYGLFLIHVPVMLAVMYAFARAGVLVGRVEGALLAGAVALAVGFAFGRAECGLYARLRPIGKWSAADFRAKLKRRLPRSTRTS